MKKTLLFILATSLLFGCNQELHEKEAGILKIHEGAYAFCGASGAVPTGKKSTIQGVEYDEGCAICPVLIGPSVSNLAMYGEGGTWGEFNVSTNPQTPDGTANTVWSFFWYFDSTTVVPQFNLEDATKNIGEYLGNVGKNIPQVFKGLGLTGGKAATETPKAVEDLLSGDPKKREVVLKDLAEKVYNIVNFLAPYVGGTKVADELVKDMNLITVGGIPGLHGLKGFGVGFVCVFVEV